MLQWIKAAVLVRQNDRFLLVQEKGERCDGLWNWPQGRVEARESADEAALREAREETGFEVRLERRIAVLENTFPDIKELHVYLGTIVGGALTLPEDEIGEARFCSMPEIEAMKEQLVGPWILDVIRQIDREEGSS
jgi:8-oxo-dGTP diphosphatase